MPSKLSYFFSFNDKYKKNLRLATNNSDKFLSPELLRNLVVKTIFYKESKIFIKHIVEKL